MVIRGAADRDIEVAAGLFDRLPIEQQDAMLSGVMFQIASADPDRAIALLSRYSDLPEYDRAWLSVASAVTDKDPPAAARMLENVQTDPGSGPMSPVARVVDAWFRTDRDAVAGWAAGIDNEALKANAHFEIASVWGTDDAAAARSWVASVSPGEARDAALSGFMMSRAKAGEFDPTSLSAFSSRSLAENQASRALVEFSRRDPAEAERLLDVVFTDPELRRRTASGLARQ
jgi:hypothetical protein